VNRKRRLKTHQTNNEANEIFSFFFNIFTLSISLIRYLFDFFILFPSYLFDSWMHMLFFLMSFVIRYVVYVASLFIRLHLEMRKMSEERSKYSWFSDFYFLYNINILITRTWGWYIRKLLIRKHILLLYQMSQGKKSASLFVLNRIK
jgi:uncharacterized membrane protein